jgi:hypothetical protein
VLERSMSIVAAEHAHPGAAGPRPMHLPYTADDDDEG